MANSNSPLISLRKYLQKGPVFLIPHYQRGYIWGKSRGTDKNSVQYLIESILNCFEHETGLFLQGITVCNSGNEIEIIDGQQRTTALYLLLKYLGYEGEFSISYSVRTESDIFLKSLQNKSCQQIIEICKEDKNEIYQDIYYFKKTIREIDGALKTYDDTAKAKLLSFIAESDLVRFLYIDIPKGKAVTVFTMMNGNKADMQTGEIIKAELLRLISTADPKQEDISAGEMEARKWDENMTRSKYAREWDKWLYWWNRDEIKKFYHTDKIMGLLLETYYSMQYPGTPFNFDNFRDELLRGEDNRLCAKNVFYGLRQLQKRFEDAYGKPELHNKIGAILTLFNKDDKREFILDYFNDSTQTDVARVYKYAYTGMSFPKIKNNNEEEIKAVKKELMDVLSDENLYEDQGKHFHAYAQLLRRNVEADTRLRRPFDFSIWIEKSLEHIYPKSKGGSNGIGNLVLLYKNENSGFGAKSFSEKRNIYFNLTDDRMLRSWHLLHSISVFANEQWNEQQIENNKNEIIEEVKQYYEIQ